MQIWVFLHILFMFAAIVFIVGGELLAIAAIRRRDLPMLRVYFRIGPSADRLGMAALGLGSIFGLVSAMVIGWDLLSGWLVISYVLFGLTFLAGSASASHRARLKAALPGADDAPPSLELEALLRSSTPLVASAGAIILISLIIAVMVYRPTF